MEFSWINFPEYNYNLYLNGGFSPFDCIGSVRIGDICIDFINYTGPLRFDFYVAHEETGYATTDDGIPFSYADGVEMNVDKDMSYEDFKMEAEKIFEEYIQSYNDGFSLLEHVKKPLEIW